ncbi:MAG: recombination protein O N-terminal domain-containing protein, partial [Clostridiales bacterium]|nr:recombination protein O N-terminal domain-containing protein [Clostridiales bacterium]
MNLTTQAIVLRAVNYKESDKILTLLTRDSGKLTVTARACRKSRKQGGGVSAAAQLLVWSDVVLKEYRGRWTLSEA